jgi:hypothetical protein
MLTVRDQATGILALCTRRRPDPIVATRSSSTGSMIGALAHGLLSVLIHMEADQPLLSSTWEGTERKWQNQYVKQGCVIPSGPQLRHLAPSPIEVRAAGANVVRLDKQGGALLRPTEQELIMQRMRNALPGPISKNHNF